ncbi:MAG: Ig-like domain-containing protein [Myxococcota bacterium]
MRTCKLPSLLLLLSSVTTGGCGLESIFFARDFVPTPPPHAVIKGSVGGVPDGLSGRLGGVALTARALAVDGRLLASTSAKLGESFTLDLQPNLGDQYNVRVVVGAGSTQLRSMATEVRDGAETDVGEVNASTTASSLLLEAYAGTARSGLAGTPPTVGNKVLQNGRDTANPDVAAYHDVLRAILDASNPNGGQSAFADVGGDPTDDALAAASIERERYEELRQKAVDAVGVPVICDQSRVRVMFSVDVSGQGLDGNGKKQFIRQAPKEGRVFLGITLDPSSPVPDSARAMKSRLTPNDPDTEMFDDATHGDEVAGDQVFTTTIVLPRGMRVIYKYTDGSPGEGYTGTEEWPGNARILEIKDVITGNPDGKPDCLVVRRDSFGDESSNKNFVNLHAVLAGGALSYDQDLGGPAMTPASSSELLPVAGLAVDALRTVAPLTPQGLAEARENGSCTICPPPVTVPVDDSEPPRIISARFSATDEVVVLFSEDLDLGTAASTNNYLIVDEANTSLPIRRVGVAGALVTLSIDPVDPRKAYTLFVKDVADASLDRNPVAQDTRVTIGGDTTAPRLVSAQGASITDVNPAARPADPRGGEVVVVTFSEVLDRISAENTAAYRLEGPSGALPVYAAFQRGRDVLLVTDAMTGGASYTVYADAVFDAAGNLIARGSSTTFTGLKLYKVQINAVPGHAWRSVDGTERGLPPGDGLYVTGTIMTAARGVDGADLRTTGRSDVAGRDGYRMTEVAEEKVSGQPVHRLELMLPVGTYAYKLAHGRPADAAAPPATLETVTKSLVTANDATGVQVDPITSTGADGLSYAGARLSLTGADTAGPGVLFKRENPDSVVNVVDEDVVLPTLIIGTWRDVPFGRGRDYDDGLREIAMPVAGAVDGEGPLAIAAEARDSESVLLSFDEALSTLAADLVATITDEEGTPLPATVLAVGIPRPSQAVLRTGPMGLNRGYTVLVARAADTGGHVRNDAITVAYNAPGAYTPFTPVVDEDPPVVTSVSATGPTSLTVRFSERVANTAADPARYTVDPALQVLSARLVEAGRAVVLTTGTQEFRAAYRLTVTNIDDLATPTANRLTSQEIAFEGFGDADAPTILWARAVTPNRVVLKFSEVINASSASVPENYVLTGVNVTKAEASNLDDVRVSAFNADWAPLRGDLVVLHTDTMEGGRSYTVTATNVLDPSGNPSATTATFTGVSEAPRVTVELRYVISNTAAVVGVGSGGAAGIPARAISPQRLASEREGVFIKGTALTENGASPVTDHAVTQTLGGFPEEGSPLDGAEPGLRDDGQSGDATANDNIFTITIPNVPLGSVLSYKAFASYSTSYRDSSGDPLASFADATPGPFVFADGQEYPGHDNGAWILADENGDGRVVLENLFGDEVTFKRKTGFRPFAWVTDEWRRQE